MKKQNVLYLPFSFFFLNISMKTFGASRELNYIISYFETMKVVSKII